MGSYVHSCGRLSASAESQGRLIHVIDGSGALKPDTESLPNLDHHAHFVACRIHDSEQAMSPALPERVDAPIGATAADYPCAVTGCVVKVYKTTEFVRKADL